jgi:small conductance mechanosensitive channel
MIPFLLLAGATAALGQNLPIPGLPGGLGGIGTPPAEQSAPENGPATPDAAPTATPDEAAPAADPTRALIDILRDDAAREALIRELEAAAGAADPPPASVGASGPSTAAPPADAEAEAPPETFMQVAIRQTLRLVLAVESRLEETWLRLQRVPSTLALSMRAFEGDVMTRVAVDAVVLAAIFYTVQAGFRLLLRPLRGRLARGGETASWSRRVVLRLGASGLDLVALAATLFLGPFLLVFAMMVLAETPDTVRLTQLQAAFIFAFSAVEATRLFVRMLLSPQTESLRLLPLAPRATKSLWHFSQAVIVVLGYGQLIVVEAVSQEISVFVGRAVSAVIATVVVLYTILYVRAHRASVSRWLAPRDEDAALAPIQAWVSRVWHWPVLGYLFYLLVNVLGRPGNVLLPLLWTTAQVILAVAVASMLLSAFAHSSRRRLRVPAGIGRRLPLLEERINQLRPAFLTVLRIVIVIGLVVAVLEILGISAIGGVISGDRASVFAGQLLSVLLIATCFAVVWLAFTSWVDYRLNPFVGSVPTPREITLLSLLKNAVTVAVILLGTFVSLAQLGMNIGPLLASAGVIGLAISFGAQRMVEDILSGIFIQAEGAMNVGDVVDVAGTVGTVEKLTVRSVTLRDLSGVVHVIPFSSAAKVSNYMRDYAYHVADIGVAYREDLGEVRRAMQDAFDALRADPEHGKDVLDELEWFGVNAFGASEVTMRARIKTSPGAQWAIGRAYNQLVKDIFDARGIEIPFPHQTVYFGQDKAGQAPPMHLRIDRPARDHGGPDVAADGAPAASDHAADEAPGAAAEDAAAEQATPLHPLPDRGRGGARHESSDDGGGR